MTIILLERTYDLHAESMFNLSGITSNFFTDAKFVSSESQ
jgi:hypothetical protein